MHSKCNVNGIMFYISHALEIHLPLLQHKQCVNYETRGNVLEMPRRNGVFDNNYQVCSILHSTQCLIELQPVLVGSFVPV